MNKLRIVIVEDERPARLYLKALLQEFEDAAVVGEAENGTEAVEIIRDLKPDLALLDLQIPEITGFDVVKLLGKRHLPLVAFVTAYDEYAVRAFEVNAVDYLLKPVEKSRLRETLNRAHERLEQTDARAEETESVTAAVRDYEAARQEYIERIPVRLREEIVLVPVSEIVSVVADGELLHITNLAGKKFTINYRLKDLESRLDPNRFVRLSRGAIVNLETIARISPLPGGTYLVALKNGEEIASSRFQSRLLRDRLLKI